MRPLMRVIGLVAAGSVGGIAWAPVTERIRRIVYDDPVPLSIGAGGPRPLELAGDHRSLWTAGPVTGMTTRGSIDRPSVANIINYSYIFIERSGPIQASPWIGSP